MHAVTHRRMPTNEKDLKPGAIFVFLSFLCNQNRGVLEAKKPDSNLPEIVIRTAEYRKQQHPTHAPVKCVSFL